MMQRSVALQLGQLIAVQARVADHVSVPGQFAPGSESPQDAERLTHLLTAQTAGNDDIELLGIADRDGVILHMSTNVTSFRRGERIPLPAARPGPPSATVNLYVGGPRSTWPSGLLVVSPVLGADDRPLAFVFALER